MLSQKIKIFVLSVVALMSMAMGRVYAQTDIVINNDEATEKETDEKGAKPRYPVTDPASIESYEDLNKRGAVDVSKDADVKTEVIYDPASGMYIVHRKIGDMDIATPFPLSETEYSKYMLDQSMNQYWQEKNTTEGGGRNKFSLNDIQIGLGTTGDKIFGPGGIKLKMQGSVELQIGLGFTKRESPTISERNRKSTNFDFDAKIQIAANGSVGDRIKFNLNYNTEATFDADQDLIKLTYEGKEDDIIKKIDVGNVSLPLSSTLIPGSNALFGIMTELQYGKLKVAAVVSQQESESHTVTSKNGSQLTDFEVRALDYEENRHYFLSEFFHDNYDKWVAKSPVISSGVEIQKIEVWVMKSRFSQSINNQSSRNIIAFTDLGESKEKEAPYNNANRLYSLLISSENRALREIGQASNSQLEKLDYKNNNGDDMVNGVDYEYIESARLLNSSEYTLNSNLGFISLKSTLKSDEVLAVAYEYTYNGKTKKVGELTTDGVSSTFSSSARQDTVVNSTPLFVKLVKATSVDPDNVRLWKLMMKNVYNIGGYNVQEDKFKLDIKYNIQNDSINSYLSYIPEEQIKNTPLLRLMGMDRMNSKLRAVPDGKYDFIEGYTIIASTGRVILPKVEPFGSSMADVLKNNKINDPETIKKYTFPELYSMAKTSAEEYSEKSKFVIKGQYKSSSGSEIRVSPNITRGSVRVTAGGRQLQENVGFTVDYSAGIVRITDEAVLASNSQVQVTTENESMFASQRKSLFGVNLDYAFNEHFNLGATIMHLSEKPLTNKVGIGYEPISNTIWGINGSYSRQSNWLTKITDAIPLIEATAPSQFTIGGEFAQLIPGHGSGIEDEDGNSVSYIDDFEGSESSISLLSATSWALASVPIRPERSKHNDDFGEKSFVRDYKTEWNKTSQDSLVRYGLERAHFAWYHIDNIFQKKSSSTPSGISTDDMSSHYTRQVSEKEIYQNKDPYYGETTTLTTLNLAYYPKERGMYNLDFEKLDQDGYLDEPKSRWGGMMRKLETTDFDKSNIEYLEFWLMDPYLETDGRKPININDGGETVSGQLVFNLGEVSEDVLHDGMKQFEQGLPTSTNGLQSDTSSIWGRTPVIQSEVSGFTDTNVGQQDLGLDGLSSDDEKNFMKSYGRYYQEMLKKGYNNEYVNRILSDPAGDDFHHYRGSDWDAMGAGILERYKYYNGMEGNSTSTDSEYSSTSTNYPNTEDLNGDGNVNKKEAYYEYVVNIDREKFLDKDKWADNFITNMVSFNCELKNGEESPVNWYQFRIPVRSDSAFTKQGKINGFNSIRFIRMYMTGFEAETYLRFGSLEFTKTDWRVYKRNQKLFPGTENTTSSNIKISSVDIERDESKRPIGYILPPGIEQTQDPSQSQVRMENEKSMRLVVNDLQRKASVAVYKTTSIDTRQYERFKMFTHAETLLGSTKEVPDNRLHIFVRLGSDFTENYYEYMIPLVITQPSGDGDDRAVWPKENEFDFRFKDFTELKLRRNKKKVRGEIKFTDRYSEMAGDNIMTVMGNPTFGDITSMMIGIKNEGDEEYSAEIWVDEMRMMGFNEEGGWAALAEMGLTLSDFASFDITGKITTAGFGSIESNVQDRNQEDTYNLDLSTTIQLGKFFPEKAKVNMPLSISYSKEKEMPKYDPTDNDVLLKDALDVYDDKSIRDSIEKMSATESKFTSYALSNVRVGITSKKPMPYDPANFSFSVAYNKREENDPETEYDRTENFDCDFNYNYSFQPKIVEPFKKLKFLKSQHLKLIREFNFYYLPHSYAFGISSKRFYNEVQMRDYTNSMVKDSSFNNLSWDKDWTLHRTSDIKWNLSKNLKLQFASTTNCTVDEIIKWEGKYRDVPRNKEYLYDIDGEYGKEWYELLKDTILSSLGRFGEPFMYNQRFDASYNIPINKLPYLDWITSNAKYTADYQWNRGVSLEIDKSDPTAGNIAFSKRTWTDDARVNMENLYNKFNYLKNVNKKFNSKRPTSTKKKEKDDAEKDNEKDKPKTYERKNIRLKQGNKTRISHRLNTTRLAVAATDKDGNPYKIKYTVIDANAINLVPSEDATGINIVVTSKARKENGFTNAVDYFTRFTMMLRNVSANYRQTNQLTMNGFMPSSGFLGLDRDNSNAPGGAFTFGFFNQDNFIDKCKENGWLNVNANEITTPLVTVIDRSFQAKAVVEPYPGFKIDVNSAWNRNTCETYYYQEGYDDRTTFTGSLSHSDITIRTAFSGNEVNSEVFDQFVRNIDVIRSRTRFEVGEFPFDEADAGLRGLQDGKLPRLSADVLVPAFVAAYRGQDASSIKNTKPLPKLWMMLPNWKVTFDILSKSETMKKHFKQFNITHGYKCTYNTNSFGRYNDWTRIENSDYGIVGLDMIRDANMVGSDGGGSTAGQAYYASEFTVDNVSFAELFNPLVGVNTTLKNSLRFKAEYKQGRNMTLDVPSLQVVESHSREFVFGTGYRIDDFGGFFGAGGKQKKVTNDLNLNLDASYKSTDAYIRKIESRFSEQSSGLNTLSIQFVAQYVLSEMIKLELYYQHSSTTPKVSTSYPISNNDVGFRIKLQLTN